MGIIHRTSDECADFLGRQHGLTGAEVMRALEWAKIAKSACGKADTELRRARWDFARVPEPKDGKSYCPQCDRRVTPGEAGACSSQWCKAKEVA